MRVIADLHLHGRYSRATSKDITMKSLEKWGKVKGLNLIGTGDFSQPDWRKEIGQDLTEDGTGILKTDTGFCFVLQNEISLIYSDGGRGRRVHIIMLAPDFGTADQITEYLKSKGRVDYDGRPIFKIPCDEFTYELKKISEKIEVIPAHIWTPWFSLFGSNSGYNKIEDCFKDQTKNIHALETGLSSDPPMNWRLSNLDRFTLISNSDSHSFWPWRIGRECNLFDIDMTYDALIKALRTKKGMAGTVEVDPNYGKYHFDGHRVCNVCLDPKQTKKLGGICPQCGKGMTIGVLNRVEELADRPEGYRPKDATPFYSMISVSEIISILMGKPIASKYVWAEYNKLIAKFGSEMNVLLEAPFEEMKKVVDEKIAETIMINRQGKIKVNPGYDGEYGIPVLGEVKEIKQEDVVVKKKQTGIKDFL